ncbi:MAG: hypothetical protein IPM18_05870 [Phycisphaerales bacterium]|nr:hypothetical protein [Phycisphaerales bacterium]
MARRRNDRGHWRGRWAAGWVCAVLAAMAPGGTITTWQGGTGLWSNAGAWSGGAVPDNGGGSTWNVFITNPASDVSIDLSATVDTVSNAGTLWFMAGNTLTVLDPAGLSNSGSLRVSHGGTSTLSGRLHNTGFAWVEAGSLQLTHDVLNTSTFWVGNGTSGANTATLRVLQDLTLSGGGELYFASSQMGTTQRPAVEVTAGATLTNAADHRIHGGAGILRGAGRLVNHGLIDADVPLRTLTIETGELTNSGELWGRSGNLDIRVNLWTNEGVVRASGGSLSTITGNWLTNAAGAQIESVGGAQLAIDQNVLNSGDIAAVGGGTVVFSGNARILTNLPQSGLRAESGKLRFAATNGLVQNIGTLYANSGEIEFANNHGLLGGVLDLHDSSRATVLTGTSALRQVVASLDATSMLGVRDDGAGTATMTFDGELHNSGGTLFAVSRPVNTATFNLNGEIYSQGGQLFVDGGDLNVANATWFQTGGPLSAELRNGGDLRFTNVDATIAQLQMQWNGVGGELRFENYRKQGPRTQLGLAAWSAHGSTLNVLTGSDLLATGPLALPTSSTVNVTNALLQIDQTTSLGGNSAVNLSGASAVLRMPALTQTAAGSLVDLTGGSRLETAGLVTVGGTVRYRGGQIVGGLHLLPNAGFEVTTGTNTLTGPLTWEGDRIITLLGSSTLNVSGTTTIPAGSTFALRTNNARFGGSGTVVNSGWMEGGATSNGSSTFLDKPVTNLAGGVVRSFQNGAATNTFLQVLSTVDNQGLFEADGANLYFNGVASQFTNRGTLRAVDNPAGSRLIFLNNARMFNQGGATVLSGPGSSFEVSAAAQVEFGALTLANNAGGTVTGANSLVAATGATTLGPAGTLNIVTSGRFRADSLLVDGTVNLTGSGTLEANTTLRPGGRLLMNSGTGTQLGDLTLQAGTRADPGRLALLANNVTLAGAGTVFNAGLIEGGATTNNTSVTLAKGLRNETGGVVRAIRNGATLNTTFSLTGPIENFGLLEGVGANVQVAGNTVLNAGTLRAAPHPDVASKVLIAGGANVQNQGGHAVIDGPLNMLEVSGASTAEFSSVGLLNGAGALVTGAGSRLTAPLTVPLGSTVTVAEQGVLAGSHVTVAGQFVSSRGTVTAPVTLTSTASARSTYPNVSFPARFEQSVNIGPGAMFTLQGSGAGLGGGGVVSNGGLLEGVATSTNGVTYLFSTVRNETDGIIRARQSGAFTGTRLQVSGRIDNHGLIEADGSELYFTGAQVTNRGTLRTLPGGSFSLRDAAQWDGDGLVHITPGTTGLVTGANTRATVGDLRIDGMLTLQTGARVEGPVTVSPGGQLRGDSGVGTLDGVLHVERFGDAFGRLSLVTSTVRFNGGAVVYNNGLIEGGSPTSGGSTFLDLPVWNEVDGVVRAFAPGAVTNSHFRLSGAVTNFGVLEAEGGNLWLEGAQVVNHGVARALAGRQLRFVGGATLQGNGVIRGDGAGALVEVSGGAVIQPALFELVNGANALLTDAGSRLVSQVQIAPGSQLTAQTSARLEGPGVAVEGTLLANGAARLYAPVSIGATGQVQITSGTAFFDQTVSVARTGADTAGRFRLLGNNVVLDGVGSFENSGVIEGGAPTANNVTTFANEIHNLTGGVVRAFSNNGVANTTFRLTGNITNHGLLEADAATLDLNNLVVTNQGGQWLARNGGRLLSTAAFVSGGGTATVEGAGSRLELTSTSVATFDALALLNGGAVTATGTNTLLHVASPLSWATPSAVTVSAGARLLTPSTTVGGVLSLQTGNVTSNVQVAGGGRIEATAGASRIDGPLTIGTGGRLDVTGGATTLVHDGVLLNAAGGILTLNTNGTALSGAGTFTNAGLFEGGGFNNANTTTISKMLINQGEVVASPPNGATTAWLQISAPTTANSGVLRTGTGNLLFTGGSINNSGQVRALGDRIVRFQSNAVVTGGGTATVDGDASRLELLSGANVRLGGMSLLNGGDVSISGARLEVVTPFSIGASSLLSLASAGQLAGGPVTVTSGVLDLNNGTVFNALTVAPTGTVTVPGSTATLDGQVALQRSGADRGRLTISGSGTIVRGAGTLSNSGLIESASTGNSQSVFLDSAYNNTIDGLIRARQGGSATNTSLIIRGAGLNAGTLEAEGAILNLSAANLLNNGLLRALPHAAGSKITMSSTAQITNPSGVGALSASGAGSAFEVLSNADAFFNTVTLTNGATGLISGTGSTLAAAMTVNSGSTLTITSAGELTVTAGGLTNSGQINVTANGRLIANGPFSSAAGSVLNLSGAALLDFNAAVTSDGAMDLANRTLDVAGPLSLGPNATLIASSGARLLTAGDVLIQSTQANAFASRNTILELSAAANVANPVQLEAAGVDLGSGIGGLTNNFAWGTLLISGIDGHVRLVDLADNPGNGAGNDALYVSTLTLTHSGARLILNGVNVYYGTFNGTLAQIDTSGGGTFVQLTGLLPEPGAAVLWLLGAMLVLRRRR